MYVTMINRLRTGAAIAATAALFVGGHTAHAAETLKIGVPTDLSGTYADLGNQVIRAVEFAVDEANAGGNSVEYKSLDTEANPENARRQSEKLIRDGYPIILGLIASGEGLAIAPMMERWGGLYISTINKADGLTGEACEARVFRVNTQSAMDALTIKPWLDERKEKKWAVVAVDIAWGQGSSAAFATTAESAGKEMVGQFFIPPNTNDFAPYIQQVKDSGAEGIWVVLAGRDAINFAQQAKQFGLMDSVTVAGQSFTTDNTVKALGDVAKGIYGIINYSSTLDTPENKAFVEAWRKKYDSDPTNFEGETYVGMQVLLEAVQRAGSNDPEAVAKAMSGGEFDTIMGKLKIRAEDHQLLSPNYFGVVEEQDGVLRPVITMTATPDQVAPPVTCKM
jgi:branched-chain amino acid transport system substrate-binding protein